MPYKSVALSFLAVSIFILYSKLTYIVTLPEKRMTNSHENYKTRAQAPDMGSNRAFGVVFAVIFLALGAYALFREKSWAMVALLLGAGFLAAAYLRPGALRPLNLAWFKFGLLLHRMINPLIMGVLFFGTITPMALLCRALGKDLLKLKPSADKKSYWVERTEQSQFENQF